MLKIAINPHHKNKMPKGLSGNELRSWWRTFNAGFRNFTLPDVQQLIQAIGQGYAYTAQHSGYRKADQFKCGQHVGLDFDTGDEQSSLESLAEISFVRENAAFIHTTPSHTELAPRSRVIFVLERPIIAKSKYSLLTESFADAFTVADQSCSDPVRLFFGAEECDVLPLGNTLTLQSAAEIVNPYKEKLNSRPQAYRGSVSTQSQPWLLEFITEKVRAIPDGRKWKELGKLSRLAGGHVAAGYYTEREAKDHLLQAIAAHQSTSDLIVAQGRIDWGIRVGKTEPVYLKEDSDPVFEAMMA